MFFFFFFYAGNDKHKFGEQRVWGAIGYGTMSAISGFCVDLYSKGQKDKDYTPGFMISLILFLIDIYVATKLEASYCILRVVY